MICAFKGEERLEVGRERWVREKGGRRGCLWVRRGWGGERRSVQSLVWLV